MDLCSVSHLLEDRRGRGAGVGLGLQGGAAAALDLGGTGGEAGEDGSELVERAKRGDVGAYARLVAQNQELAFGTAYLVRRCRRRG